MEIRKNAVLLSLSVLVFGSLVGCGLFGGATATTDIATQGQSGMVIQGVVSGATVWADSLVSGTRGVIDTAEQSSETTTDASGSFTLPVQPTYKYVLVSQGGTDTITGKTATTMLAPAGSKVITGLTTLVSLDTSGNLATVINALLPAGTSFDSDISATGGLTPASMVLLSSIETAVNTFTQTVQDAATKSGATLTQQQQNYISLTLYSQIASTFSGLSSASLSNTQSLAINLQTALTAAASSIQANNTNITIQNASTVAASIANNSVATAANVIGNATSNTTLQNVTASNVQSAPVTVSTGSTVTETTVMTASNTQLVNNTVTNVSATDASNVTVTSTSSTYTPPVIAIINNPTIVGYHLSVSANGSAWIVSTFEITFSDVMVASASGDSTFGHSVLNPANYQFTPAGCSPVSYSSNVVTFSCANLSPGTLAIEIYQSNSSNGVWASGTSLGLPVNNLKTFTLPSITGSTGGSSLNMF